VNSKPLLQRKMIIRLYLQEDANKTAVYVCVYLLTVGNENHFFFPNKNYAYPSDIYTLLYLTLQYNKG
jgi:hypothetical protein